MVSPNTLAKIEVTAAVTSFGLIFVAGLHRFVALRAGADENTATLITGAAVLLLFFIFGFACIGLMIDVFVALQTRKC